MSVFLFSIFFFGHVFSSLLISGIVTILFLRRVGRSFDSVRQLNIHE